MALKNTLNKKSKDVSEQPKRAVSRKNGSVKTEQKRASSSKKEQETRYESREEILDKYFCPENIKFLKDTFGVDLNSPRVPVKVLHQLRHGRVTDPIDLYLKPLAYDAENKRSVQMPAIKSRASLKVDFYPVMDKDSKKQLPVTPENFPIISVYPCYDYAVRGDVSEQQEASQETGSSRRPLPVFTEDQKQALEGIGINRDRLYKDSYNAFSLAAKQAMAAGEEFYFSGRVKVYSEMADRNFYVNVNGYGTLGKGEDGRAVATFEAQEEVEKTQEMLPDLASIRRVEDVTFDFLRKDKFGIVTDASGRPELSDSGRELCMFGRCLGPVEAEIHKGDKTEKAEYLVSMVNGGLCFMKFNEESLKNQIKDGTVSINKQKLEPASPEDLDNYAKGIGGMFKGYKEVVKDGDRSKEVIRDAYLIPDSQNKGFAVALSADMTSAVKKYREEQSAKIEKKAGRARRKVGYSF